MDTRVFRGADIGSDHYMTVCRLRLRFSPSPRSAGRGHSPNLAALENEETRERFQTAITETFRSLDRQLDPDTRWKGFRDAVVGVALRICGRKPRNSDKIAWLTPKVLELMAERDMARQALLQNRCPERLATYRRLRNNFTSALRKAERQWYGSMAARAEAASREGRTRDLFGLARSLQPRASCTQTLMDADGNVLGTAESRRERWREHFSELLNPGSTPDPVILETLQDVSSSNMEAPLRLEEVRQALKKLRSNRTPGVDGIAAELLWAGGPPLEEELLSLLTVVWDSECIPSDWRCAIIVAVFKKGDRRICANHRGVSLLEWSSPGCY
jgi:hypothetical protein